MEEKNIDSLVVWINIPNFENYQVNNLGDVRSLDKMIIRKNGRNYLKKGKILAKEKCGDYLRVSLFKNNKIIHKLIHRLVAEAFIPNLNKLPEVNHKNENKKDNRVENLEWCTSKYNCNYGERNKKIIKKRSKPINQYDLDGNFIKRWNNSNEAAKYFNKINGTHILKCCNGTFKQMYGFKWRYVNERN